MSSEINTEYKRYTDSLEQIVLNDEEKYKLIHTYVLSNLSPTQHEDYQRIMNERLGRIHENINKDIALATQESDKLDVTFTTDYNNGVLWNKKSFIDSMLLIIIDSNRYSLYQKNYEKRIEKACNYYALQERPCLQLELNKNALGYIKQKYLPKIYPISNRLYNQLNKQDQYFVDFYKNIYNGKIERALSYRLERYRGCKNKERLPDLQYWKSKFESYKIKPSTCIYWCQYFYRSDFGDRDHFDQMLDLCLRISEKYPALIKKIKKIYSEENETLSAYVSGLKNASKGSKVTIATPQHIEDLEWIFELLFMNTTENNLQSTKEEPYPIGPYYKK